MKKKKTTFWIVVCIIGIFLCLPATAGAQEFVGQAFSWGEGEDGPFSHRVAGNSFSNVAGQEVLDTLDGILPHNVGQPDSVPNHDITPRVLSFGPISAGPFVLQYNFQNTNNPSDYVTPDPEQIQGNAPTDSLPISIPAGPFKVGEPSDQSNVSPGPMVHGFRIGLTQ